MRAKKLPATAFKPGQSGNPSGKPRGTRNYATRALLNLIEGEAMEITSAVIDAAKAGDMAAARFVIDRIIPAAKERPIAIELPSICTATDAAEAQSVVLQAVSTGDLTPGEGNTLATIIEARRKSIETEELERRITALEEKK